MICVDQISITPNPVQAGQKITISLVLHEEYENAKCYPYKYPYRYMKKKGEKRNAKTCL